MQDEDNLREALRFSAAMLGELRTSLLTPQKYFELYMQAFDELRHLEVGQHTIAAGFATIMIISRCKTCLPPGAQQAFVSMQIFFKEEHSKGRSYADLYELVQHAGNVLPRL